MGSRNTHTRNGATIEGHARDTEEDVLLVEKNGGTHLIYPLNWDGPMRVSANCLAGLIRLENATEGTYKRYYTSGKVKYEVNYVDGKRVGKFVRYYKTGRKVYEEGNYKDGQQDGKWVYYDKDGNITDEDIWEDGKCVERCEGDE